MGSNKLPNNDYALKDFYKQITRTHALLNGYQFILTFVGLPRFLNNDDELTYRAQSAQLPTFTIDKAKVPFFGNDFRVPTVVKYDHNYKLDILLDENMDIYNDVRAWMRVFSDLRFSGGGTRTVPTVKINLNILDQYHTKFTTRCVMERLLADRCV